MPLKTADYQQVTQHKFNMNKETEDLNEEKEQRAERENYQIETHFYPAEGNNSFFYE